MSPSSNSLATRFSRLQLKERRLILLAAVGGLLLLSYTLLIEPAMLKAKTQQRLLAQQQQELDATRLRVNGLRDKARDPDALLRADLNTTQQEIGNIETELRSFDHLLVAPASMPRLLQSLLSKHRGLELVRLKTLPATPLLKAPEAPPELSRQARPAQTATPAPPPGGIYRHTIEITVAGSYADLLAYAEELQRISPRPLWSGMQLKVVEYPRSELTFTLYTLSLDLPWLAV